MGSLRRILANQPVVLGNLVGAVIGFAVAVGLPVAPEVKTALVGLVVAVATLFTSQSVISPAAAVALVKDSTTATAAALNPLTAGPPGEVTPGGAAVADHVTADTAAKVEGPAGTAMRGVLADEGATEGL